MTFKERLYGEESPREDDKLTVRSSVRARKISSVSSRRKFNNIKFVYIVDGLYPFSTPDFRQEYFSGEIFPISNVENRKRMVF